MGVHPVRRRHPLRVLQPEVRSSKEVLLKDFAAQDTEEDEDSVRVCLRQRKPLVEMGTRVEDDIDFPLHILVQERQRKCSADV